MEKTKRLAAVWFVALTLGMLAAFALLNVKLLAEPAKALGKGDIGVAKFVDQVQEKYPKGFVGKNHFVNLNGLYGRMMGRRVYNNVILLKNGMLSAPYGEADLEDLEALLTGFASYLEEKEIPLLYVQAPAKDALSEELFPYGVENHENEDADRLLSSLVRNHIAALDLRPMLAETVRDIEACFYRTDHHWTPTGALDALKPITEALGQVLHRSLDLTYADPDLWEKHTIEDWFLGSRGKRVGTLFAGVDDLIYYTPRFETMLSYAVPHKEIFKKGDFTEALIDDYYLSHCDHFGDDPYNIYGNSDPLAQYRNGMAPNDLHLLLIGDSFSIPEAAFLSTMFSEITKVDPRYFTQYTFCEYVNILDPDVVLLLNFPGTLNSLRYFNSQKFDPQPAFARERYQWRNDEVIVPDQIEVPAAEDDSNSAIIASTPKLEVGKRYTLTFEDVRFTGDEPDGVTVSLYDADNKKTLYSTVFDVAYCRTHDGFSWTFDVPDQTGHTIQLLAYGGMPKNTDASAATYQGVALRVMEETGWR